MNVYTVNNFGKHEAWYLPSFFEDLIEKRILIGPLLPHYVTQLGKHLQLDLSV